MRLIKGEHLDHETSRKAGKRITQSTVAKAAGVSTAVVSAVLNPDRSGAIRVSRETAERVRKLVREMGYTPNPIAQSLARGRRNILGVFTYEATFPSDRGNFFYPMLHGIELEMSSAGRDLLLFTSAQAAGAPRRIFADGINRLGVSDGAILLGQEPDAEDLVRLHEAGFPFVTIGRRAPDGVELNWVGAGYAQATRALVELGHRRGHRHIALLSCAITREQQADRAQGYREGLAACGLRQNDGWHLLAEAGDIPAAWLATLRQQGVTLILAETLEQAVELEHIAAGQGLRVPQDLSIAVLGTPMFETNAIDRWTRFRIPREDMGREAVKILVGLLDGSLEAPVQVTLPCALIEGETMRDLADITT